MRTYLGNILIYLHIDTRRYLSLICIYTIERSLMQKQLLDCYLFGYDAVCIAGIEFSTIVLSYLALFFYFGFEYRIFAHNPDYTVYWLFGTYYYRTQKYYNYY